MGGVCTHGAACRLALSGPVWEWWGRFSALGAPAHLSLLLASLKLSDTKYTDW